MRARLLALAAVSGLAVAAFPADAATAPKPQIIDDAGDANGINDQDTGSPVQPHAVTDPASYASGDILSTTFATTFVTKKVRRKKVLVPTGFTVTLKMAAPPTDSHVNYNVLAELPGCDGTVYFEYGTSDVTGVNDVACYPSSPTADVVTLADNSAVVKGNLLVFTVPAGAVPVGTTLSGLEAETLTETLAGTIDQATTDKTFKVGQK